MASAAQTRNPLDGLLESATDLLRGTFRRIPKSVIKGAVGALAFVDNIPELTKQASQYGIFSRQFGAEVLATAAEAGAAAVAFVAGSAVGGIVGGVMGAVGGATVVGAAGALSGAHLGRQIAGTPGAVVGGLLLGAAGVIVGGATGFGSGAVVGGAASGLTLAMAAAPAGRFAAAEALAPLGVRPPVMPDSLSGKYLIDPAIKAGLGKDESNDALERANDTVGIDAAGALKKNGAYDLSKMAKDYKNASWKITLSESHAAYRKLTEDAGITFGDRFDETKFMKLYPAIQKDLNSGNPAKQAGAIRTVLNESMKAHDFDPSLALLESDTDKKAPPAAKPAGTNTPVAKAGQPPRYTELGKAPDMPREKASKAPSGPAIVTRTAEDLPPTNRQANTPKSKDLAPQRSH